MGVYRDHVLPRLVDLTCGGAGMERWRRRAVHGLRGDVVEIGFGSGANLTVLPAEVRRLYAVEPSALARDRSARRVRRPELDVEHIGLDGQSIPLPDGCCDGALSTFTLCTIPDAGTALDELRRVLRPGGQLHFLEHGRAPDERVRRWQERLEPLQKRVAGGCHLTRDIPAMLEEHGFQIDRLVSRYAKGPKPWTWFSYGVATTPSR